MVEGFLLFREGRSFVFFWLVDLCEDGDVDVLFIGFVDKFCEFFGGKGFRKK